MFGWVGVCVTAGQGGGISALSHFRLGWFTPRRDLSSNVPAMFSYQRRTSATLYPGTVDTYFLVTCARIIHLATGRYRSHLIQPHAASLTPIVNASTPGVFHLNNLISKIQYAHLHG